jgi:hypothetical protein
MLNSFYEGPDFRNAEGPLESWFREDFPKGRFAMYWSGMNCTKMNSWKTGNCAEKKNNLNL